MKLTKNADEWEKKQKKHALSSSALALQLRSQRCVKSASEYITYIASVSRTCIINSGITLWKAQPLKWRGRPAVPAPFSPVHRLRKFSAVFGVTSERSVISIRPHGASPMTTSKKTMGLPMSRDADVGIVACGVRTSFSRWVVAIDGGVKDEESFPTEEFPCTRALTRAKIYRQFVLSTCIIALVAGPSR